jgi:hypothetical protein
MTPNGLLSIMPLLGVMLGVARVRYPRVPWLAAGSILALYALFVAVTGAWASTCWDCSGNTTTTRGELFGVSTLFFGITITTTLAGIWLGTRLIVMLGRLRRTIGELRGRE